MYVYIYISWAIKKSGCVYNGLQIILLVGNNTHMRQPCRTLMHASADIFGYFEHNEENGKYGMKYNKNGQQCLQ